jgi:hypothetical protein
VEWRNHERGEPDANEGQGGDGRRHDGEVGSCILNWYFFLESSMFLDICNDVYCFMLLI